MPKTLRDLLLEALDDLDSDLFRRFTGKLTDSREEPRVRRGEVDGKDRVEVARLLTDRFTGRAGSITAQLLRDIGANQVAEDLETAENGLPLSPGGGGTPGPVTSNGDASKANFITQNSAELIRRATGMEAILDVLLCKEVINSNQYSEITAKPTAQGMMRSLIHESLRGSGISGKAVLYDVLMHQQNYMMQDMGAP